jgi:hypothetical protein
MSYLLKKILCGHVIASREAAKQSPNLSWGLLRRKRFAVPHKDMRDFVSSKLLLYYAFSVCGT